jgi:hypothetical protein
MLVELCICNYATYDGLLNGVGGIFKALTTYCDKTIIWIMFQIFKIANWQEKNIIITITTLKKMDTNEPIIKDIKVGKSQ